MIKRMGLFQRRQDLTQTQFSAYWAKKHSPLVMRMPKFLHYTQNHCIDFLPNFTAGHPAFEIDGIAEMYWHDEQEMQQDFNSQQSIELLRQDETEFMSSISVCIVEEAAMQGIQSNVKIILSLSSANSLVTEQSLKQVLPNLRGIQRSDVQQMMDRPQLPALPYVPQQFFSLWYDQYAHVLADFESGAWQTFYTQSFQHIQRISVLMVHPLKVRVNY
ncbi:EthD domain-containing protein [Acinetobacter sp. ANC 3813]|uniref:EthD domain-containing protein n=1 Tax=Acinetobacter sp. ANC 3813 TaxID=1977873 RepID=UPI000A3443E6|nr:EthD domain-containing protein [Acinetobacter sp. ANC 3813]OTG90842.1 hypothetical protein B9T34_05555 [Acinetobacter sp. ANC 3813]